MTPNMGDGSSKRGSNKDDPEYSKRRERNNTAVKKSRQKTRAKTAEMEQKVHTLKKTNNDLEIKIQTLTKELQVLQQLFIDHADQTHGIQLERFQLVDMLREESADQRVKGLTEMPDNNMTNNNSYHCMSPTMDDLTYADPNIDVSMYSPVDNIKYN